ncbi:MAG: ArsA-related P-loop ATPase, partial [Ornithinimicrobium sp.]
HTAFVVVLAAERLPVLETIELERDLARLGSRVDALVVNKRSPRDAGSFLAARHGSEEGHLAVLSQALPDIETTQVPLLAQDVSGLGGLDAVSRLL